LEKGIILQAMFMPSAPMIAEAAATAARRYGRWRHSFGMARRLYSIKFEAHTDRDPIPNRVSAGVRDHDKLNLDRLFANSRDVGHDGCEFIQHEVVNQLIRKAVGKHQGLGNAARNVGKPLQGSAFVVRHGLPSLCDYLLSGYCAHMHDHFAIPGALKFISLLAATTILGDARSRNNLRNQRASSKFRTAVPDRQNPINRRSARC
jgi:hypothetical protein